MTSATRPRRAPLALALAAALGVIGAARGASPVGDTALLSPQTVEPVTRAQFQQVLEHHRGKVVLVNLWATWCIPCVQELPELDELQHRYRERGLLVIAVSFDDLDRLEHRVRPFFKETAPRLISYLQVEDDPFTFVEPLDRDWLGALPTSFIFDRAGKLRNSFAGRTTFRALEDAILPFLAEEQ